MKRKILKAESPRITDWKEVRREEKEFVLVRVRVMMMMILMTPHSLLP